jgi:REP element-mobilizing transposase RayT
MLLSNDIRHGRHCVFALYVHLVFVTKYRRNRKVFDGNAINRLKVMFEKVCTDFEAQLIERNGEVEHVHLLIHYPPKHSVSSLVNSLKGVSSRLLRLERPDMEKRYWKNVLRTSHPVVVALHWASLRNTLSNKRRRLVNVTGAIVCAREAVRRLSTKYGGGGGAIVNVSSRAAKLGSAGEWVHYAMTKGAIDTLTIGLAREVATEGIRVNAVAPGLVETALHAAAGDPSRLARLLPTIPMGRARTPEEIAEGVL